MISGIAWSRHHRRATLIFGLAVVTLFPTALLARVGELHAHTVVFWFAALVAIAVDGWMTRVPTDRTRLVAGLAVVYVAALAIALRIDLGEMRATGERSASLLSAFRTAARDLPSGSVVRVRGLENVKAPGDYSLYRLTTPGMLLSEGNASLQPVTPPGATAVDERDWAVVEASLPKSPGSRTFVVDFAGRSIALRERTASMP